MRRVRQTSVDVFHQNQELLSERRRQVYVTLFNHGPATGTQLAQIVKRQFGSWGQSETIRNRLTELRDLGVVEEVGTAPCPINGRTVIWWEVTDKVAKRIKKDKLQSLREELAKARLVVKKLELEILKLTPANKEQMRMF